MASDDTSDVMQQVLYCHWDLAMTTISEIQEAILALREPEFVELKKWLSGLEAERRWEEWDDQIEADSEAGKLNFLLAEAMSIDEARHFRGSGWEGDLGLMRSDRSQAG